MPNEISSYLQACMRLPIMVHLKQQILFHFRSIRKRYLSMNISSSCYCLQGAFIKSFYKKIYNNIPSLFWQKTTTNTCWRWCCCCCQLCCMTGHIRVFCFAGLQACLLAYLLLACLFVFSSFLKPALNIAVGALENNHLPTYDFPHTYYLFPYFY